MNRLTRPGWTQFDEADRRMSAEMARKGSQMAIDAWVLSSSAKWKRSRAGSCGSRGTLRPTVANKKPIALLTGTHYHRT
jgi:hypothetical protein